MTRSRLSDDIFPSIACIWEALARKVGNVHPRAEFADTGLNEFILSALAIQSSLSESSEGSIGTMIRSAVEATKEAVQRNTNLGMCLLLAPLIRAYRNHKKVDEVLAELTIEDADCVYQAIRLANPGGLGDAPEQDVHSAPTVTLLEAMKLAADRDMIARQYANGFADVFDFGVPAFLKGFEKFGSIEAAIIDSQFQWLANYPDSLIARKNGLAVAEDVRRRAADVQKLGGIGTAEGRRAGVALDKHLRSNGNKLNPGTTADLIAACLFVALREGKVKPSDPFRWHTDEWL
ncbi:MAG TPA: triphosphoribosyl-dephospho-CoA synthase [Urbifossiella sp.]|jgi:triphosphoribosyl-dephospho-CoA synthase